MAIGLRRFVAIGLAEKRWKRRNLETRRNGDEESKDEDTDQVNDKKASSKKKRKKEKEMITRRNYQAGDKLIFN